MVLGVVTLVAAGVAPAALAAAAVVMAVPAQEPQGKATLAGICLLNQFCQAAAAAVAALAQSVVMDLPAQQALAALARPRQ